jgi:hypothetical protein
MIRKIFSLFPASAENERVSPFEPYDDIFFLTLPDEQIVNFILWEGMPGCLFPYIDNFRFLAGKTKKIFVDEVIINDGVSFPDTLQSLQGDQL